MRQGRRRAFHLYQAWAMGPMVLADMLSFFTSKLEGGFVVMDSRALRC